MSEFFSNYPRIAYDISGSNSTVPDYTVAVNLLIRNKLRDAIEDDITIFYPYVVPEGMRQMFFLISITEIQFILGQYISLTT